MGKMDFNNDSLIERNEEYIHSDDSNPKHETKTRLHCPSYKFDIFCLYYFIKCLITNNLHEWMRLSLLRD
jgi:hypothetical protein